MLDYHIQPSDLGLLAVECLDSIICFYEWSNHEKKRGFEDSFAADTNA